MRVVPGPGIPLEASAFYARRRLSPQPGISRLVATASRRVEVDRGHLGSPTPGRRRARHEPARARPQSVGGPRAGASGGGSSGLPRALRIFRIGPGSAMNAISRMSPPQPGHWTGNSMPTRARSLAQGILEVSWQRGLSRERTKVDCHTVAGVPLTSLKLCGEPVIDLGDYSCR